MITKKISDFIVDNSLFKAGVSVSMELIKNYGEEVLKEKEESLIKNLSLGVEKKMLVREYERPFSHEKCYEGEVYIFNQEELRELLDLHENEIKSKENEK